MKTNTQSAYRHYERNRLGDANTFRALVEHEPVDARDKHDLYAFILLTEEEYKDATQ